MVSLKRFKPEKSKLRDVILDDKDNLCLLQVDQKESHYNKSKNGRLRIPLFSRGLSKRNVAKSHSDYEPPTAPSSPADKTPLSVTVLTGKKFDHTPYAVNRADTNISDLTPHMMVMPGRRVEFDPSLPSEREVPPPHNSSNPLDHDPDDQQPALRGVSLASTFSSTGLSAGSTGGDLHTQGTMEENITVGTRSTSQPPPEGCNPNDDFVTKTLGLFDDLCRVNQYPTSRSSEADIANGQIATAHQLVKSTPINQMQAADLPRPAQPFFTSIEPSDEEYDEDESFMQSIETTVDGSSTNDGTHSVNTNSMTTGTNYLTANTTQEGGSKSLKTAESTTKPPAQEKQPLHENFEVVLESSLLRDSPKRRGWFSKKPEETNPVVAADLDDDVEIYQHEVDNAPFHPEADSIETPVLKNSPAPESFTPKKKSLAKRLKHAVRGRYNGTKSNPTDQQGQKKSKQANAFKDNEAEGVTSQNSSWNKVVQQLKQPSKTSTKPPKSANPIKVTISSTNPSDKSSKETVKTESSSVSSQKQRPTFTNVFSRMIGMSFDGSPTDASEENAGTSCEAPKKPKSMWKAVTDPKTGRTYYYHRRTRETTWTKPPEVLAEEKAKELEESNTAGASMANSSVVEPKHVIQSEPPSSNPASNENPDDETSGDSSPLVPPSVVEASMSPKTLKRLENGARNILDDSFGSPSMPDSDPHEPTDSEFDEKWQIKKEINRLLTGLSPPDKASVNKVMDEYEGNEEQLLRQLRDLVESQPFDEPFLDEPADLSRDISMPQSTGSTPSRAASPLKERARTVATHTSSTTKSSNHTDMTEKVRNHYRGNMIDTITEGLSPLSSKQEATPKHSHASLSIPQPYQIPQSTGKGFGTTFLVPRNRELKVEEFSDSRIAAETYDANGRVVRARTESDYTPNVTDDNNYYGDNEVDTYGTDSVSALSENDADFSQRKENFEQARRKALDEAIEREDWELAAALSEGMRTSQSSPLDYSKAHGSWTQSELDKFISQNDWNAVSEYIAKMREGTRNLNLSLELTDELMIPGPKSEQNGSSKTPDSNVFRAPNGSKLKSGGSSGMVPPAGAESSLQKRIGSRSQLQHSELLSDSQSSWTSESSFDSSFDSNYS